MKLGFRGHLATGVTVLYLLKEFLGIRVLLSWSMVVK